MNNGNPNLKNLLSPSMLSLFETISSAKGLSSLTSNLEKMTSSSPRFNLMHMPSTEMLNNIRTNNHLQNIADKLDNLPSEARLKDVVLEAESSKEVLWLEYTAHQEVILNGIFILHGCQVGSMNDRLLRNLIQNPNRSFTVRSFLI